MFAFRSKISWIDVQGGITVLQASDFEKRCVQMATVIQGYSARKVCLLWEPGIQALAAFIGCILANKIPCYYTIPNFKLDANYFQKQIAGLRNQDLLALASSRFRHLGLPVLELPECSNTEHSSHSHLSGNPNQPLFMQFSSGTTGIRKRISYAAEKLTRHNADYAEALGLKDVETVISWLPHYHDMGLVAAFLLPLAFGFDIIGMSNLEWLVRPDIFVNACYDLKPTLCWQPNFAFDYWVARCPAKDLSGTRFISCAEPVFEATCRRFEEKYNTRVHGCYAMAENIFATTQAKDYAQQNGFRSSGEVFGSNEIKIDNEEILLRSQHLFQGYDTGEDSQIREGWYHTGDSGYLLDGKLYVLGRTDDIFKSRGNKIIPDVVEQFAGSLPGVKAGRVACIALPGKKEGDLVPCMLFEGDLGDFELLKGLRQFGIEKCVQVPDGWLIKSSSGKISRKNSRAKYISEMT